MSAWEFAKHLLYCFTDGPQDIFAYGAPLLSPGGRLAEDAGVF